MSLDTAVQYPCPPRVHFGGEIPLAGTQAILNLLRAKGRADAAEDLGREHGQEAASLKITVNENYGGQIVQRQLTLADLRRQAEPLNDQAHHCESCVANLLKQPYGCFVTLHYPVPASSEQWLFERLEPAGSTGWNSCHAFLQDHGIRGTAVAAMRSRGFFESRTPLSRRHKLGVLRSQTVTTDQLLEFFVRGGEALLEPPLCALFLMWFGCIGVQGAVPGRNGLDARLQRLEALISDEPEKRRHETSLLLQPSEEASAGEFSLLFTALYRSWVLNVPLYYWG